MEDDQQQTKSISNGVKTIKNEEPTTKEVFAETPSIPRKTFALIAGALVLLIFTAAFLFEVTLGRSQEQRFVAAAGASLDPFGEIRLDAKAVYVLDVQSNTVLFAKNEDAQLPLASLTKVPLVFIISRVLPLDSLVQIPREAVVKGEGGGLGTGDTWLVRDLIDFTLAASSNAGAEALAIVAERALREGAPGAPEGGAAVWRMNTLAQELHLRNTYFLNASGLDESETQSGGVGSARDMAILFAHVTAEAQHLFSGTTEGNPLLGPQNGTQTVVHNTNEALPSIPGLILGKTGFTDLAGGNLAVVFEIGPDRRIVAVVMGSTSEGRFEDIQKLVAAAEEWLATDTKKR